MPSTEVNQLVSALSACVWWFRLPHRLTSSPVHLLGEQPTTPPSSRFSEPRFPFRTSFYREPLFCMMGVTHNLSFHSTISHFQQLRYHLSHVHNIHSFWPTAFLSSFISFRYRLFASPELFMTKVLDGPQAIIQTLPRTVSAYCATRGFQVDIYFVSTSRRLQRPAS